jgi:hypothetical protein
MIRRAQAFLLSLCLAALAVGSGHANTYTYTRSNAGETTGLLPGMSIDQSNFAGGTFGTTGTTYPAVNFDAHKAGTQGVQLNFSIPTGSYRLDIPQGVNACYGIKWAALRVALEIIGPPHQMGGVQQSLPTRQARLKSREPFRGGCHGVEFLSQQSHQFVVPPSCSGPILSLPTFVKAKRFSTSSGGSFAPNRKPRED